MPDVCTHGKHVLGTFSTVRLIFQSVRVEGLMAEAFAGGRVIAVAGAGSGVVRHRLWLRPADVGSLQTRLTELFAHTYETRAHTNTPNAGWAEAGGRVIRGLVIIT